MPVVNNVGRLSHCVCREFLSAFRKLEVELTHVGGIPFVLNILITLERLKK